MRSNVLRSLFASAVALQVSAAPAADSFPQRPVRMIIPYAPGGTTDIVGRIGARELGTMWNQPVVPDNRLGAGGNIATELVAKSAPDGYTLLLNTAAIAIAPNVYKNLQFDATKDFIAVSRLGFSPALVLVNPGVPAKSLSDLLALARAQPGKLNFGSSGTGASLHLATELFKTMAKVDMVHVPYKGSAPALTDLLGGQIQILFDALATALPLAKSGKVRALAVTTAERSPFAPDVPTISESGVKGYDFSIWYGIFAPAKTPAAVVTRLNGDIARAVQSPAVREQFAANGVTPKSDSLAGFTADLQRELRLWAEVSKAAGIKPQ